MLPHYRQRKPFRHQKTWHQYRQDLQRTIRSRCDYILGTDRRLFEYVRISEPRHFSSDHYMLIGRYLVQPTKCHKHYLKGRRKFPLTVDEQAFTEADRLMDLVLGNCPEPDPQPKKKRPSWISDETRKLMD